MTGEGGMRVDYEPGELGFDPLGLAPQDPAELNVMKTKELNNGRLAVSTDIFFQEMWSLFVAKVLSRCQNS